MKLLNGILCGWGLAHLQRVCLAYARSEVQSLVPPHDGISKLLMTMKNPHTE